VEIPDHFKTYPCTDYYESELSASGHWDDDAQVWVIVPASQVQERTEVQFLVVGRPGVDGIDFGYRKSSPGFWAYCPIDGEYQYLAPTITAFLKHWDAGAITL
jgi:hypothetical protein